MAVQSTWMLTVWRLLQTSLWNYLKLHFRWWISFLFSIVLAAWKQNTNSWKHVMSGLSKYYYYLWLIMTGLYHPPCLFYLPCLFLFYLQSQTNKDISKDMPLLLRRFVLDSLSVLFMLFYFKHKQNDKHKDRLWKQSRKGQAYLNLMQTVYMV